MDASSGYAWITNADPLTGVPAIVGEFWAVDEFIASGTQIDQENCGAPLDDLRTTRRALDRHCTELASRSRTPIRQLVRIDGDVACVLHEEPLSLNPDAVLRFLYLQRERSIIGDEELLRLAPPEALEPRTAQLLPHDNSHLLPVTQGVPCSGGAVTGILVPYAGEGGRRVGAAQRAIVVVDRIEAQHTDLLHEQTCAGVLAVRGSPADHFTILAREARRGYLVLPGHMIEAIGLRCADAVIEFGAPITVDFADGRVYRGTGILHEEVDDPPRTAICRVLAGRKNPVAMRVGIDSLEGLDEGLPVDSVGIGLLRIEHLLRRHGLSESLRCVLESADDTGPQLDAALETLGAALEQLLLRVLRAARGLPVTVRLLDYPLHELGGRLAREVNPMLGLRGVRQGVRWPNLYAVQIRTLLHAAIRVRAEGTPVEALEVLVPMVCSAAEVRLVRDWVQRERAMTPQADTLLVRVGAMLETPVALADIDDVAAACDIASFGTNDLTQLVLGLSREDYVPILEGHRASDLLTTDPFERIHPTVLRLIREAAMRARLARPELILSLCGSHATDPQVLELVQDRLLDHLTVPLADLTRLKLSAVQRAGAERDDGPRARP